MNISLLHIGMMKTASTYMQNTWSRDPNICLAWKGTFSLLQTLRNGTIAGELKPDDKLEIQIDKPAEGQQVIVSNEGFSTAFLNGSLPAQQSIPSFIELASSALGRILPQLENVLIVVRNPFSWIRSMHIQSIKEGGYDSANDFVEKHRTFLIASLNLTHIVSCYSSQFANLTIAPYELLKENEPAFWNQIHHRTGVRPPSISGSERNERNASLNEEDAYTLAQLNKQSTLLMDGLSSAQSYTRQNEKESLINTYQNCSPWVNRRFIEHANESLKSELKDSMKGAVPSSNFFQFRFDQLLGDSIRQNFIDALRNTDGFEPRFIEDYETQLEASLQA